MRRSSFLAVAAVALAALLAPLTAQAACQLPKPVPHVVDPAMQATDHVPPKPPFIRDAWVGRPRAEGCGGSAPNCDGYGLALLEPDTTDDVTPNYKIGYRITLVEGILPAGLVLPAGPVTFPEGEYSLWLAWDEGGADNPPGVSFTLQIVAVDLAGNESTPVMMAVTERDMSLPSATYDDGDCRISNSRTAPRGVAFMAILALVAMSRRRRAR